MPSRIGKRYSLLIYTHMINRWWPAVFTLGLATCGLAWAFSLTIYGEYEPWRWITLTVIGVFVSIVGLIMFAFRKGAYVQPADNHLRLVTPFLRLNISYKRIRRATTAQMGALFPPKSLSNWRQEILEPLASRTAVVIELNGFPTTQTILKLFFSPFFFKDKTPHFVLLVDDWMGFSTAVETFRAGGEMPSIQKPRDQSILSRLPRKE
jgi:hypothetical protein